MVLNVLSSASATAPRRPGQPRSPALSWRERLFGDRSTLLVVIFLAGLAFSLLGIAHGTDEPVKEVNRAALFAVALLSAARDDRVRALSAGLLAGLVWSSVGIFLGVAAVVGLLAGLIDYANGRVTSELEALAAVSTRAELQSRIRRSMALQGASAVILVTPMFVIGARLMAGLGAPTVEMTLVATLGAGIAGFFLTRRLQDFSASFVGRPGQR